LTTKTSSNTSSSNNATTPLPNPKPTNILTHPRNLLLPMCNHHHSLSHPNTTILSQVSPHGTNHALVHPAPYFVKEYQGRPGDQGAHEEDDALFPRGEGREPTCCEFSFHLRNSWRRPGSWAKCR